MATEGNEQPSLLLEMYRHFMILEDALCKIIGNEENDATHGVMSFEGHDAINMWENAGFASMEEAWSMRHFLDHYFESVRGV